MREATAKSIAKFVLIVWAAVMALFWTAGAPGDEPRKSATPAGSFTMAGKATLGSIIAKMRHQDQDAVQPEVIPLGIPVPQPAGNLTTDPKPTLASIIAKIRRQDRDAVPPEAIPPGVPVPSPGGASSASAGQATSGEPWRYERYADRWWYWMPDNHWMWWDKRQGWVDYSPPPSSLGPPQQSSSYSSHYPGCYGHRPPRVAVGPGAVAVHAGPVFVRVVDGHVGVSVFGIGFGF